MKKFVCLISISAFTAAVLVCLVNGVYKAREGDPYYTKKFSHVPKSIQVCNFGSSHGYNGFCYDEWEDRDTFNFALGGQTLSYDLRLLKNYCSSIDSSSTVLITVSYFSFFGIPETKEQNFREKNQRYYGFLPKSLIKQYDGKDAVLYKFPALTSYEMLPVILFSGGSSIDGSWYTQTADSIDLDTYTEAAYESHMVTNKIGDDGRRIINTEELDALYRMIGICQEKDARAVMVTTPFLEEYYNMIEKKSPEFIGEFERIVSDICENTGVEYYDYSHDSRFAHAYKLFLNADHLNHEGAMKFTDIIMSDVVDRWQGVSDKVKQGG